jgi:hypothetical protein
MPMTKLFGMSATGFNSGEDDIENYNAMVETEIRSKVKSGLLMMLKVVSQKLFGFVPESLAFEYKPLRIMSNKEESELKSQNLQRCLDVYNAGLLGVESVVSQINASKIFPVELKPEEAEEIAAEKSLAAEMIGRPQVGADEAEGDEVEPDDT